MKIEKKVGSGAIAPNDVVCLLSMNTGKQIEVEAVDALFSGNSIHLLAHTGNRIEAEPWGGLVRARWSEPGLWQTFTIESYAGRAIYSGDMVWLKSHNGALVHVQGTAVMANWGEYGDEQRFIIQKTSGSGAIKPDDLICLRAYNGRFVDVEGTEVQVRWLEPATWKHMLWRMPR